jgi:hypothetical protein
MYLTEMGWEVMDRIHLAKDRDMNMVINFIRHFLNFEGF